MRIETNKLICFYSADMSKKNFTLLDAGCGIGSNLNSILKKYPKAKIIGIDNYQPDLEIAQNFFLNKADFILGDCIDTKLNSSSVDVVLSNQVIEHITRYDEYLNEIKASFETKRFINFINTKLTTQKMFF